MACSYDEDVCSNEFKLLCGENVRTGRQTPRFHASDRPAAPPRRRWVLLSIGIPSQRFRWLQGEPAAQPLAARECLRQKPAAAEAGVGKDAKKTQKQLEQATS